MVSSYAWSVFLTQARASMDTDTGTVIDAGGARETSKGNDGTQSYLAADEVADASTARNVSEP